jgi:hypothetical protein
MKKACTMNTLSGAEIRGKFDKGVKRFSNLGL